MSKSIAAEYQAQPWIMEQKALKAFAERISAMPENAGILAIKIEKKSKVLNVTGGVARIAIEGYLLDKVPGWLRLWGIRATGYDEIVEQVTEAAGRDDVDAIELIVDSPGGMVAGVISAADAIYAARQKKPVTATVNNLSASGAYWLSSQADKITASDINALAGSIGVYTWYVDWTDYEKKEGIKVIVIRSGEHKGMGLDSITDNQIAAVQEYIDATADNFIEAVARGRGANKKMIGELATGQLWIAKKAKSLGLIDKVAVSNYSKEKQGDIKGDTVMDQNEIEKQKIEAEKLKIEAEKKEAELEKARAGERARVKALSEEFADDPQFAMRAAAEGWSVKEAQAQYCAVLREKLKCKTSAENHQTAGAPPLMSETTDDGTQGDFMTESRALAEKKSISLTQAMKRVARTMPGLHQDFLRKSEERGKAGYAEAV
jgi:signal peptide peptidase SppA